MSAYPLGHVGYIFPENALGLLCGLLGLRATGLPTPEEGSAPYEAALAFLEEEGYVQRQGRSLVAGESIAFLAGLYARGSKCLALTVGETTLRLFKRGQVFLLVNAYGEGALRLMPLPGREEALEELLARLASHLPAQASLEGAPGLAPLVTTLDSLSQTRSTLEAYLP